MNAPARGTSVRSISPTALLLLTGAVAALAFMLPRDAAGAGTVINSMLVVAPALAVAACMIAARSLPGAAALPWLLYAVSAAAASVGQLHWHLATEHIEDLHALANVGAMALFAFATGWILHQRDRERGLEVALDAGMVIAVATVITLRWSPAAGALLDGSREFSTAGAVSVLITPIAAGCAFLFGSVLLIVRGVSGAAALAAAIAVGAAAVGLAVAPVGIDHAPCCSGQTLAAPAFVAGWLALGFAGVRVRELGGGAFQPVGADAGGSRLRMVVAPAVAITIAVAVIDAAWQRPLQDATSAAIGLLGVLLALRVSQLLVATRTQSAERLQLAQSRALIEVSRALSGARRLDETLSLVSEWAVKLLDGQAAAIELLTPDGKMLEFHAVHGLPEEARRLRFPVDGSFSGWVVTNGKARSASDPSSDPFISAAGLKYLGRSAVAAAPLLFRDQRLGALSCVRPMPFTPNDIELLGALADQAAVAIESARLFEQVHQLSLTDPLTGLPNRRQLERDLAREFAAARRGRRLACVMFDLNGFKEYNDRYGHVAGDRALRHFGEALAVETRAMNMAARYGGDEFIALLADTDGAGAETFIARVRDRFPGGSPSAREQMLSVAAGYACHDPDMDDPEDLVAAADRALYEAKSATRAG